MQPQHQSTSSHEQFAKENSEIQKRLCMKFLLFLFLVPDIGTAPKILLCSGRRKMEPRGNSCRSRHQFWTFPLEIRDLLLLQLFNSGLGVGVFRSAPRYP